MVPAINQCLWSIEKPFGEKIIFMAGLFAAAAKNRLFAGCMPGGDPSLQARISFRGIAKLFTKYFNFGGKHIRHCSSSSVSITSNSQPIRYRFHPLLARHYVPIGARFFLWRQQNPIQYTNDPGNGNKTPAKKNNL